MEIIVPEVFKELFVRNKYRYKVFYGGRGGAKSHAVATAFIVMGMQETLRIVCAREIQKSIKGSVHTLLKDIIVKYELQAFYEVQEACIRGKNGTEFIFRGLKHNAEDLKSLEGADFLWIEEAANVSNKSYETVIPTIRKENSEIWITFNPRNATDPTYKRFIATKSPDVYCKKVSHADNPFFPEVLRKEMEKLKVDDYEAYLHVWEGELDTRHSGAVHAKAIAKAREEGRVTTFYYDPNYEVFTAWDLGYGDSTTIWWLQFVGRELRWIDYYENSGELLEHYAKVIKEKEYNYIRCGHFLPHDGAAKNIRGESPEQQLKQMGIHTSIIPRATDLRSERDLLNNTIAYSVFNDKKCSDGLLALESYHFEYDEDRGCFKREPEHDWSSHACDAARYAAIAAKKIKGGLFSQTPIEIKNKSAGLQTISRFKNQVKTKELRSWR